MRRAAEYKLIGIAAAAALVAGCASEAPRAPEFSGFLGNYSNMTEIPAPEGQKAYRWVSPKLKPSNYDAVMVTSVQFYPRPQATAQVSQETLDGIRHYASETFVRALRQKVRVVTNPGKGIVKIAAAITAVRSSERGLAAYQYVPIAFVLTMAKRGVSGTPEDVKIVAEIMGTDSVTGEVLGKSVRVGTGRQMAAAEAGTEKVITVDDVKPVLDSWADITVQNVTEFVKAR